MIHQLAQSRFIEKTEQVSFLQQLDLSILIHFKMVIISTPDRQPGPGRSTGFMYFGESKSFVKMSIDL